jgi:uncharacterized protein YheU (UPF0270 family)
VATLRLFVFCSSTFPVTGFTAMFIPWQQLSDEALSGLVDSYCTQYHGLCSDDDLDSLESRRAQVMQALRENRLVIRWSESEESAWIVDPEMMDRQ